MDYTLSLLIKFIGKRNAKAATVCEFDGSQATPAMAL